MGNKGIVELFQTVGDEEIMGRFSIKRSVMQGGKKGVNIILVIMLAGFTVGMVKNIIKYVSMTTQKKTIAAEIETLREENSKMQAKINNFSGDRQYIEKFARERLNLVRQGETVFIMVDE